MLLGPTVYSLSIILACLLAGLALGSGGGAFLVRRLQNTRLALGWCQLLLVGAIAFAAYLLFPFFPEQLYRPPSDLSAAYRRDMAICLVTMLPAACLWGASFPFALAAAASSERDPGRLVGRIYAANTVGAVVGATLTSLILLAWLGTENVQRLLIACSALAAVLMFLPPRQSWQPGRTPGNARQREKPTRWGAAQSLATLAAAGLLAARIGPVPGLLVAFGAYAGNAIGRTAVLYAGEGMNTSVAVTEGGGIRSFHVSGKVEASNAPPDMQHLRMLGHIPALIHRHPRSVLVVGCGAGITAGSLVAYPSVERMTIVEIEPLVPRVASEFFSRENLDVIGNPRVAVINDDGRHYVLTTPETFDIITSDAIHPWVKGSASLYTREYFEYVRRHLNPGGIVSHRAGESLSYQR